MTIVRKPLLLAALIGALIIAAAGLAPARSGPAQAGLPPTINYLCYWALDVPPGMGVDVLVQNQFWPAGEVVTVDFGAYFCPPASKEGAPALPLPDMRCFFAYSPDGYVGLTHEFADQFGALEQTVENFGMLCVPASKVPGVPPPPEPYYACYDSYAPLNPPPVVTETQFGPGTFDGSVRIMVCVPSLKEGAGSTDLYPTMTCYWGAGDTLFEALEVETQFGIEALALESSPSIFCTQAVKSIAPTPFYACHLAPNPSFIDVTVDIETQFGLETGVLLPLPFEFCVPAFKNGTGDVSAPPLRCFLGGGPLADVGRWIQTQFRAEQVTVRWPALFCVPAAKGVGDPPAGPSYSCYFVEGDGRPLGVTVDVETQFIAESLALGEPVELCVPAVKNPPGSLPPVEPFVCYNTEGTFVPGLYDLVTQFGPETTLIDSVNLFCAPAAKTVDPPPKQADPGDTDGDGCSDADENRPKSEANLGGGRDYLNPWDFYDVLGPGAALPPDGIVDLPNDILGVILHFSPTGAPPYDAHFDRGPWTGPNSWTMTPPDGFIDLPNDILGVIFQFSHDCR